MGGATRGIVLPPRRAATRTADAFTLPHQTGAAANGDVTLTGRAAAVVAGVRTPSGGGRARATGAVARPRRRGAAAIGGFSITRQAGMGATGGGTPPSRASGVTAARVVKPTRLASPPVGGRRVVGTPAASPSGGALTSARGLAARRESLGATGSTAAAPRTPAVRKGGTPPSGDSPVSFLDAALRGVQHTAAPVAPHGVARSVTVPPGSPSPVAAGGPPSSSAGAHRPSMCRAPVQANLTAAAPLPRALSFVVPERDLPDPAGQKSLTPSVAAAPPKAIKGIRKPTKPRAKRGAKNATASPPPVQPAVSAGTPTAASQTGWTPIADLPPVHPVGERPIPTVVTVATMTKVFAEGLRPVCVHLAGLSQKLAVVHTSVNRLSINLHSQGVGNERTAQAVVQLQGALRGVYEGVISHTKKEPVAATALRGSTAMLDNCEDQLELATINELEVGNVRDVAKKMMINEMLGAKESYRAMPNRVRALEILYDACLAVRGASQDEAVAYLCSQRVFLTTAGSPTETRIRVSEKLYRISSHVVEALQKVAMVAYFKSLGESIEAMTPATAEAWLRNNKYAHSATADPAINAALKAMFRRNGHHARVVTPKEVGDGEYVDATVGHVGLIAHWARGVFEKVAGVRKARRTGKDDGAYDGWRAEVRNVSTLLPWHGAVAGGLRLTDGTEEHRAMNVADDGTYVIECSEDEELPEGSAGSSGQQWDSSQGLMPGRGPVSAFAGVDDGLLGDDVFEGEGDVGGGDGAVGAEREEVAEALGVADGAEVDEEWEGVEGEEGAD